MRPSVHSILAMMAESMMVRTTTTSDLVSPHYAQTALHIRYTYRTQRRTRHIQHLQTNTTRRSISMHRARRLTDVERTVKTSKLWLPCSVWRIQETMLETIKPRFSRIQAPLYWPIHSFCQHSHLALAKSECDRSSMDLMTARTTQVHHWRA